MQMKDLAAENLRLRRLVSHLFERLRRSRSERCATRRSPAAANSSRVATGSAGPATRDRNIAGGENAAVAFEPGRFASVARQS